MKRNWESFSYAIVGMKKTDVSALLIPEKGSPVSVYSPGTAEPKQALKQMPLLPWPIGGDADP